MRVFLLSHKLMLCYVMLCYAMFLYRCSRKCLTRIGEDGCIQIFSTFYNLSTKNEQDLFLQGQIDAVDVQRRRPGADSPTRAKKTASFKYYVVNGGKRTEVCFKGFLSVYSISEKRVWRIRNLKLIGDVPFDKRGKGVTYTLSDEVKKIVRNHIKSFPLKESHYCGKKVYYMSADLSLKKMWKLFCHENPSTKVSYSFYFTYYCENFNHRFGRPQVDTCAVCEELNVKLKSPHLNDNAKRVAAAEKMVHIRRRKKFYSQLESEKKKPDNHVLALTFDYMKTISLPKIPVQELYYMRQLSLNLFCIHNIKKNTSSIYLYHEGNGRKGPNEGCTFLREYLKSLPEEYTELHLYCDNCAGQNKNQALSRFCLYLTDYKVFKKIEQFFPVPGHSFLPCDRDFGLISKALRKHDRLYTPEEVKVVIENSSSIQGKFSVNLITADKILNFKTWMKKYYKKTCISKETRGKMVAKQDKVSFQISTLYHFVYESNDKGNIKGYGTIGGIVFHNFPMGKTKLVFPPTEHAYPQNKVPTKQNKMADIRKLNEYIPEAHSSFYNSNYEWPTTSADLPDSDLEQESDHENEPN